MSRRRHRTHTPDDDLKYAPGVGARVPPSQRPLGVLERATITHVAIFFVTLSWALAGEADALATPLAWWGSLGLLLTLTAVQNREAWREGWMRPLVWLWPFVALNALVLLASARPVLALKALWIFDGVWLGCFNLALIIRQRRAIRLLLLIVMANALALGVLGVVQYFMDARWFSSDDARWPQSYVFATFAYMDHWGAFALLMIAAGLALAWHYGRRRETREYFVPPAMAGIVIVAVVAATLPVSRAYLCAALGIVLLGAAMVHFCARHVQRRRQFRESTALPFAGIAITVVLGLAAIWYVVGEAEAATHSLPAASVALQSDPWETAKEKPWFGWGMGSFEDVFALHNPQTSNDSLPVSYTQSDWLQAFTELGIAGSLLLVLCAVVPLLRLRRRHFTSPMPAYLLGGCALVAGYSAVASPFQNTAVMLGWWLCFFSAVQYARLQDREAPAPKGSGSQASIRPAADCVASA